VILTHVKWLTLPVSFAKRKNFCSGNRTGYVVFGSQATRLPLREALPRSVRAALAQEGLPSALKKSRPVSLQHVRDRHCLGITSSPRDICTGYRHAGPVPA